MAEPLLDRDLRPGEPGWVAVHPDFFRMARLYLEVEQMVEVGGQDFQNALHVVRAQNLLRPYVDGEAKPSTELTPEMTAAADLLGRWDFFSPWGSGVLFPNPTPSPETLRRLERAKEFETKAAEVIATPPLSDPEG